jgi:hypothetical protein
LDRNNDNISDCDGSMCRYLPCVWNTAEMEWNCGVILLQVEYP